VPLYRVTLAYDGSDFLGWQAQGDAAQRTVQGVLEAALAPLGDGRRIAIAGAGRTDAGVHALGQVASFELDREWAPERLARALNGLLPADVRVLEAALAPPGFHARRSAIAKLYRYLLDTGPVRLPTRRRCAGYERGRLDPALVAAAAALYLGRHDFAAVASTGSSVKTSVRMVLRSEVRFLALEGGGETLVYEVEADGFLRKMVRSLVGGLLAAGLGQRSPEDLAAALASGDRARWPPPAEACGLTLVKVRYPESPDRT
jgi:tRNA pseudouridine38-40 synthase